MLLSSFLFSIIFIVWDYVVKNTNVATVTFWEWIWIFVSTLFFFFYKKTRDEIIEWIKDFSFKKLLAYIWISWFDKLWFITTYKAFSLAPTPALVYVIEWVQPFILLVLTTILTIFFPNVIKENIEKKVILQKIIWMVIIFVGIYILYLV